MNPVFGTTPFLVYERYRTTWAYYAPHVTFFFVPGV